MPPLLPTLPSFVPPSFVPPSFVPPSFVPPCAPLPFHSSRSLSCTRRSRARPIRRPSMSAVPLQERLLRLERALTLAVSQERYSDAASLRDALLAARRADPALSARDALLVAVESQDFAAAARLRDEIATLTERLSSFDARSAPGQARRVDRIVVLRAKPDQPGRLRVATVGRDGSVEFSLEPPDTTGEPRIYLQPCFSPSGDFVCCTEISFKVLGTEGSAKVVSMSESSHRVVVLNAFDGSVVKSIPVRKPPFFYCWSPCGRKLSMLYNGASPSSKKIPSPTVAMSAVQIVAPAGEEGGASLPPATPIDALTDPVVSGHPVLYDFCPRDSDRVVAHVGDRSEVVVASLFPGRRPRVITSNAGSFGTPQWHPQTGEDGREVVLYVEGAPTPTPRPIRTREAKASAVATAAVSLIDALRDATSDDKDKGDEGDEDHEDHDAADGDESTDTSDDEDDDDEDDDGDLLVNFIDVAGGQDGDENAISALYGEGVASQKILPARGISDLVRESDDTADPASRKSGGPPNSSSDKGGEETNSSTAAAADGEDRPSGESSKQTRDGSAGKPLDFFNNASVNFQPPNPASIAKAFSDAVRRGAESLGKALPEGAVPGIPTGKDVKSTSPETSSDTSAASGKGEARGANLNSRNSSSDANFADDAEKKRGVDLPRRSRLKKEPWGDKKDRDVTKLYMADTNDPTVRRVICRCSGIVSFKLSPDATTLALLVNNPDTGEDELSLCHGDFSPDSVAGPADAAGPSTDSPPAKADIILSTPESKVLAFFWSPDGSKLLFLSSKRKSTVGAARWATFDMKTLRVARYEPFIMSAMFAHSLSFFCAYSNAMTPWSPDSDAFCYAGRELTPEEKKSGEADDPSSQANAATLLTALMLQKKKAADSGKGIPFAACVQDVAVVEEPAEDSAPTRGKLVIEPPRVVMENVELAAWSQC